MGVCLFHERRGVRLLEIYLSLFIFGILVVAFAWYRGRKEKGKVYSWRSYASLFLSMALLVSLFFIPQVPPNESPLVEIMFAALFIGSPVAFLFSLIALFKRKEKNLLAIFGLFFSLILLGTIILLIIFVLAPFSP